MNGEAEVELSTLADQSHREEEEKWRRRMNILLLYETWTLYKCKVMSTREVTAKKEGGRCRGDGYWLLLIGSGTHLHLTRLHPKLSEMENLSRISTFSRQKSNCPIRIVRNFEMFWTIILLITS